MFLNFGDQVFSTWNYLFNSTVSTVETLGKENYDTVNIE